MGAQVRPGVHRNISGSMDPEWRLQGKPLIDKFPGSGTQEDTWSRWVKDNTTSTTGRSRVTPRTQSDLDHHSRHLTKSSNVFDKNRGRATICQWSSKLDDRPGQNKVGSAFLFTKTFDERGDKSVKISRSTSNRKGSNKLARSHRWVGQKRGIKAVKSIVLHRRPEPWWHQRRVSP